MLANNEITLCPSTTYSLLFKIDVDHRVETHIQTFFSCLMFIFIPRPVLLKSVCSCRTE